MADDHNQFHTSTNWWDSSRINSNTSPSSSSGLSSLGGASFGWSGDMARSSVDSVSASGASASAVFHDTQKLQGHDSAGGSGDSGGGVMVDPNLHMMGLGLPKQALDWNQALLRGDKGEGSFRSMLQENLNSIPSYQQETNIGSSQVQWRDKMFSGVGGGDSSSSMNEFKQMNRGFSLDQSQLSSPHGSSSDNSAVSYQMDSSVYGSSSTTLLQGLLGSTDHNQPQQQSSFDQNRSSMSYQYGGVNYPLNATTDLLAPSWSRPTVPQFLRTSSPPKQPQPPPPPPPHSQLHFSNNAPFWNASAAAAAMTDVRPNFFPSLQTQFPAPNFDEKPKNISEVRETSLVAKKCSGSEQTSKRPRNETPSPLPAFKVRKEKMGDRITALQQLVSPFGKTDTASVLSEAIEYIKFLHEQVNVLSTPYMKSGASIHHQQSSDKSKEPEGPKQDLRSRGLCLVPVSSTFPVTHESPVEFWTPTFGGTFR